MLRKVELVYSKAPLYFLAYKAVRSLCRIPLKLGKIPLSSDQGQSYVVVYWVKNKINNFRFLPSVWKPYSSSAYRLGISPYCFARHVTKNDPDFYYGRTLCY